MCLDCEEGRGTWKTGKGLLCIVQSSVSLLRRTASYLPLHKFGLCEESAVDQIITNGSLYLSLEMLRQLVDQTVELHLDIS